MIYEFDENGMTEGIGVPTFINDVFRWHVYFDGNSYITIPKITLSGEFSISVTGTFSSNGFWLVTNQAATSGDISARILMTTDGSWYVEQTVVRKFSPSDINNLCNGNVHSLKIARNSSGEFNVYVDGVLTGVVVYPYGLNLVDINLIGYKYFGGTSVPGFTGYMLDININNQRLYKLDKNVYPSLIFKDSLSNQHGQGYNFQESSFVTELP
jgi:hypothetical protein